MARTNRSARKSTGGRVPRGPLAPRNPPPQEEPLEMIPEEEVPHGVEEVPQEEEVPQDQPQEVGMLPAESEDESKEEEEEYPSESESDITPEAEEPLYRNSETFKSYGEEAVLATARLRGLLSTLHITTGPEYHVKRVPRPGRDEFKASIHIYNGRRLLSTHSGPTFRSTCSAAVTDAAWEAMTAYSYDYRDRLDSTIFRYVPQRERGSKKFAEVSVGARIPRTFMVYSQNLVMTLSDRVIEAQEEIQVLRKRLLDTEASFRARLRVQDGEASDLHTSDRETWTATSPDRAPEEHPPVESHPTGRTPSPSGSRTR